MNEERHYELETKIAFLERHIEEQDKVVLTLQKQMDRLRSDVAKLIEASEYMKGSDDTDQIDERPPHY